MKLLVMALLIFIPQSRNFILCYFLLSIILAALVGFFKLKAFGFYLSFMCNKILKIFRKNPEKLLLPVNRELTKNEFRKQFEAGIDINSRDEDYGFTPLIWSIRLKCSGIAKKLIKSKVDIEARDKHGLGWTPLIFAVNFRLIEVVKYLIDAGVIVDKREKNTWHSKLGWTPIMMAAAEGDKETVKLLLKSGANINNKAAEKCHESTGGETVLNHLIKHVEIARYNKKTKEEIQKIINSAKIIIELGADITIKDWELGESAIWLAISNRVTDLIIPLILAGANLKEKNEYGESLIEKAERNKCYTIAKILREHRDR